MAGYRETPVDRFGKDAGLIKKKKLFLFDMDGTIYRENVLFEGTLELLNLISGRGGNYVFVTNNSSRSVDDYVDKVGGMGIKATRENFFTSSQAAAIYLKENFPGALTYCQGTRSFLRELVALGIRVTEDDRTDVDVVLVGFDTELSSGKIIKTCRLLQTGKAPFLATNPDLACPVSFGFVPDCGSICRMLENATGRKPEYIGKPKAAMVNMLVDKFHVSKEETVVIGDRLYTDIATGANAGVDTVCVLTGEATIADIIASDVRPTLTFNSVKDIYEILLD